MAGIFRLLRAKWFPPPDPTASFSGQTVLITGANSGVGFEAAAKFALLDASRVILGVRSVDKGDAAMRAIEQRLKGSSSTSIIEIWPLDMNDYSSIRTFASRASSELSSLDTVVLNAGVNKRAYESSAYGWETTLQVNVLSTALLALLLAPKLRSSRTSDHTPVLEIVSSGLHSRVTLAPEQQTATNLLETYNSEEGYSGQKQYGASKLFVAYVAQSLAKIAQTGAPGKEPDFFVVYTCPGACASSLGRDFEKGILKYLLKVVFFLLFKSSEQGARTYVLAAARGKEFHGKFVQHGDVFRQVPLPVSIGVCD